jgi:hypothetical protein
VQQRDLERRYEALPKPRKAEQIIAHKTIETHRANILKKLRKLAKWFSYDVLKYDAEVPQLAAQLKKGLLPSDPFKPNTEPKPLSAVAIMNAGWEVYKGDLAPFFHSSIQISKSRRDCSISTACCSKLLR